MLWKLVILLTVVPLLELYLLVKVTVWTNFAFTVALILLTGLAGAVLARMQGLMVLRKMQRELAAGKLPADSLMDGAMILVAAALLVTPGILTDACGFLLLIPWSRRLAKKLLKRWIERCIREGSVRVYKDMGFGPIQGQPPGSASFEEGEDEREGDDSPLELP